MDIPNGALHVYYEPATGAEVFGDGNETFAGTLWGDWGGGSTTDNIFGNEALNIPLNGKIRIYVLLCDYNSPSALGNTVDLGIINDGISLAPALNSFTKLRVNPGSISQRNIILPVKFTSFSGTRDKKNVQLKWQATLVDNADNFIVQQSYDGVHFSDAGIRSAADHIQQSGNYGFTFSTNAVYFRIMLRDNSGIKTTSNTIWLQNREAPIFQLLQNPVKDNISIENISGSAARYDLRLSDITGKILLIRPVILNPGISMITIPPGLASQVLLLHLQNTIDGSNYSFKVIRR